MSDDYDHGFRAGAAYERDAAAARIATLEAALREIKDQYLTPDQSSAIARAALAPEQDK